MPLLNFVLKAVLGALLSLRPTSPLNLFFGVTGRAENEDAAVGDWVNLGLDLTFEDLCRNL